MITRVENGLTYTQTLNVENQLISVTVSGQTTQFIYDGGGNMVKKTKPDGSKTIYVGGIYEVDKTSGGTVTKTTVYYPAGGAMRVNGILYYTLKDQLGSASITTDSNGNIVGEQRYYPFGETRLTTGSMFTDKLYTSQREITGLGIYHYGARFYSPKLGRFLSADTIIPGAANPQAWNRYSYALNNPIRYTDPDGHSPVIAIPIVVPFVLLAGVIVLTAIAIHPKSRAAAIDSLEYVSKRSLDIYNDFLDNVTDTNNGKNYPKNPCTASGEALAYCIVGFLVIGGTILYAATHGGCNELESNSICPPTTTPAPTSTLTLTPTPANTSTSTPSCPPYIQCPNTPTPPANNTPTPPVVTPSPTPPIFTPAPPSPGGPAIPI